MEKNSFGSDRRKRSGSLWWKKPELGVSYLLVTETEDDEADAYILKELPQDGEETEAGIS